MSLYQHIKPGLVLQTGNYTFDAEKIKRFAAKFDPQPFHLDEEAAKKSVFGELCASGWHTISVWMRLNVDHGRRMLETESGYHGPPPEFGMSPGAKKHSVAQAGLCGRYDQLSNHGHRQTVIALKTRLGLRPKTQ